VRVDVPPKPDTIQCDENRPVCRLCAVSDRQCRYSSAAPAKETAPPAKLSGERSFDITRDQSLRIRESHDTTSLSSGSTNDSNGPPLLYNAYDASSDAAVNFDHIELLVHLAQDCDDVFNLVSGVDEFHHSSLSLGLREGVKFPYLMHALLAFSAQHLAYLHPKKSSHYLHQAVSLQTRAISLFNASWSDVNESNCVAILLFSSILGHHLLAETLCKRDPAGLDGIIAQYVQCMYTHRGIYTIAKSVWPLLMASEIEPILSTSAEFTSRTPTGNECQDIIDLVESSADLSIGEKDACRKAIQYLQVGFDAIVAKEELYISRHHMINTWTMLVPPEYTSLLARKQPVALILLAYYAVLVHQAKDLWQARDAGAYVFDLISDQLGSEWDPWMRYPREKITGEMSQE
jgi:hypothetical protein